MITFVVGLLLSGLVLGALGRLLVPGPNPMGIFSTICCGWAGAFLAALVGRYVLGWRYGFSFLLGVVFSALIVLVSSRRGAPGPDPGRRA